MNPRGCASAIILAILMASQTQPISGREPDGTADRLQIGKLGPLLRLEMLRQEQPRHELELGAYVPVSGLLHTIAGPDGRDRIPCWVRHDGSIRLPQDALVGMDRDGITTARLTLDQIDLLSRQPGVLRISMAQPTYPLIDAGTIEIGADVVHAASGTPPVYTGLTGQDVVIGIIDTGIDVNHEDFRDHLGDTRISFLWDQTAGGTPPTGFGYGREWTAAQINAGSCTQTDIQGHGTHVAGIAAGDGSATGHGQPAWTYVGVAPKANLIVVKSTFYSTDVADGVDYVFRKAQAMGLKAVVNLSLGNHYGPHNGTSDLDQAMNSLGGPNRIIVAAAGNEQTSSIHAEATIAPGDSAVIVLEIPAYAPAAGADNDLVYIDGYYPVTSTIGAKVVSPNAHSTGVINLGSSWDQNTDDGAVYLENTVVGGVDHNLFVALYDQSALDTPEPGEWRIVLYNTSKTAASSANADFWIYYSSIGGSLGFTQGVNSTKLVASPATADSVIAVGAYVSKKQWTSLDGNTYGTSPPPTIGAISSFSSHGPRRDGALKPNVSAPGQVIGSALSTDLVGVPIPLILSDGVHFISQGTSMAAPQVAGLVALMLSQQPLSTFAAIEKLETSSRSDGHTGVIPNTAWGWGKIDAIAATSIPSPIILHDVAARWDGAGGVTLEWVVPVDLATMRFKVHRDCHGVDAVLLGETESGPGYTFRDATASREDDPGYWLEPIAGGHGSGLLGPYRPAPSAQTQHSFTVSLPSPNPSGDHVRWRIRTPGAGKIRYEILDPAGRRVWSEGIEVSGPGLHELMWDGFGREGRPAAAGLYWIRTQWEDQSQVHKLIRVRRPEN